MVTIFDIFRRHGRQYVPDLRKVRLPAVFRGKPVISPGITSEESEKLTALCPAKAIIPGPLRIDMGRCIFCMECHFAVPDKIKFTNDYKIAATKREDLIITEGQNNHVFDKCVVRPDIKIFRHALKLRQVSAGGDNSAEMELNAAGNVNFDMGRFGIEFVASPRHADGIVITGPVTANMADALQLTYDAVPKPKIIILAGSDAISGGMYSDSPEIHRTFIENHHIDLYVPGNPPHPLSFINGIIDLIR